MSQSISDHNTRAAQMWSFIEQHYDFENKSVLDLGCGAGDMIKRAQLADARIVVGVDIDLRQALKRLSSPEPQDQILLLQGEIAQFFEITPAMFDAVFCFSVLPYLPPFFEDRLREIRDATREVLFLEVQYSDDIGEVAHSEWANAMYARRELESIFSSVRCIGTTRVKSDQFERDIWKCIP